jgi:LmbE family N-acetylglucosaminyl deacetylase
MSRAAPSVLPVEAWPQGDIAVVSPHLDDAALSLGAAIAALARLGRRVQVVTPFAGDPGSDAPPNDWETRSGFSSAGESAAARRNEDLRACALLGAEARWLPYDARSPDGVEPALLAALADVAVVLVPAAPCSHDDHEVATRIVLDHLAPTHKIGLYVDQPYAMWRLLGERREVGSRRRNAVSLALRRRATAAYQQPRPRQSLQPLLREPLEWHAVPPKPRDLLAKQRSILAYTSQMRVFSRLMPVGIGLYEWQWGGEAVAWLVGASA